MRRFFQKVDNQLNICYKGQWYFVKKDDDASNYENVLNILSSGELNDELFEKALSGMGLFKASQNKELKIDKGNVFINDVKAPRIFTEIINNSLQNNMSVDYLIKFFKNLVFDTSYKEDKETRKKIKNLFNSQAYCPDKRSQVVFMDKTNDYKDLPFYSYGKLPDQLKMLFNKEAMIDELCLELFGEKGKALEAFVLNELLDHENKEIKVDILAYGLVFKNILSTNNIMEVYNKRYLDLILKESPDKELRDIQKNISRALHIFNAVLSNFSEKKVVSFFKKGFILSDINYIISKYNAVAQVHDFKNIKFLNLKELKEFIERESFKIESGENFNLCEVENFPVLKTIHGKHYKEIGMTCIIPKDYYELVVWSRTMGNCIGQGTGYAKKALEGRTVLIGYTKTKALKDYSPDQIHYNLEVNNGRIVQFEAKMARSGGVNPQDKIFIENELKKLGLIKGRAK